jgi:hypothetical protein
MTTVAAAGLCFGLRLMAIFCGWRLPIARPPQKRIEPTDVLNAGLEARRGKDRPGQGSRKTGEVENDQRSGSKTSLELA